MIIRCTQKLLKALNKKPDTEEGPTNPFLGWHANMFYVERRKCVLITNDITLFTLFIPALKKPDFQNFHCIFGQYLFKNLLHEEMTQVQIEKILPECEEVHYQKTNNRSVLGSMNNQQFYLEAIIQKEGGLERTDILELNHKLNRHILSAIAYHRPVKMFTEQLNSF